MTTAAIILLVIAAALQSRLLRILIARAILRLAKTIADRLLTSVERR